MAKTSIRAIRLGRTRFFSLSVSAFALLAIPAAAFAQEADASDAPAPVAAQDDSPVSQEPPAASTSDVSEITVTGTRVIRDGYEAPTPTTVLGAEEINKKAPANLADFVNQLPSLSGSVNPRSYSAAISLGSAGINALNLRALGSNRTLVLLDGRRVAASTASGLVDINTIPQALVKRVDVVTGGASADWGSDAVAGVVNFVLDKDFTGIKGTIQGGVTTYGDDRNYNVSLAAGTRFADGRGHIMVSAEIAHNEGIAGNGERDWYNGAKIFANPNYTATNGQPQLLALPNVGFTTATPGGIITSGLLAGTYFGPGGTPTRLNYGSIVSGNFMAGGDWRYADFGESGDLDPRLSRQSIFGAASFQATDHLEVYLEGSYSRATSRAASTDQFNFGSYTIQPDNAFIPASIASQNASSFRLGTLHSDLGPIIARTKRSSLRLVAGAKGDFEALGTDWKWDVSGQKSVTHADASTRITVTANLLNAIDSVRSPTGAIVCRSALTNPSNGCVPYNVFGTGVNSQAAVDYVLGNAFLNSKLTQDVYAATLHGDPFSTWAGPVSLALGVEHRREAISGRVDALDAASLATSVANNAARIPPYFAGNYLPTFGSYHVTEGFVEVVVPLAKALDFNGAVRATDYSTSGYVTTWKAGLTYKPVDDVTFRITRSRDIRAPNLSELYQAAGAAAAAVNDPFRGNALVQTFQVTSGNPNLKPERADTLGLGVVVEPRFIPGFALSVDYYNIDIKDAISTVNAAAVVDQCFEGNTAFCSQITRNDAGVIASIGVVPVNVAKQISRGIDFEASYRRPLFDGSLTLRFLGTRFLKSYSNDGITAATDLVGTNGTSGSLRTSLPKFRYTATIGYDRDPFSVLLTARGFSAGKINTSYIECTSSCPASTVAHPTINDNHMPGAIYFDASMSVDISNQLEAFLAVDNIANKDPYQMPYGPTIGANPISVNPVLYDVLGRTFRMGVRFKL
ncbi:TonB-dependent receptor [Sphingopyxis sp. CCNWLW253]|uniref:TonB-dependent receptor domain-containing protein n=1 Tax=unclassified Sphingopyxis TaxID=2614943 RepID=UPI003012BB2F